MKKLMVMAAVAMAALCSQAVAFNWNGSGIVDVGGEGYIADGAKVYLFAAGLTLDGTALVSDAAVTAALVQGAVEGGSFISDYSSKAIGFAVVEGGEGSFDKAVTGLSGKTAGDAVSMFGVIVDENQPSGDVIALFMAGDVGAADSKFNQSTGMANWSLGNLEDATYGASWSTQAVPEPTSGLLILLGVAGLALRRRRA